MLYVSSRGGEAVNSIEAIIKGIAPDGGLYMPEKFDFDFDRKKTLNMSAREISAYILYTLFDDFTYDEMKELVNKAYENKFENDDLTPTVKVGDKYVLELFRGPTSAFKDVALSMLPQLLSAGKKKLNIKEKTLILTATSGDTGKAALEGFKNADGIEIAVFFPNNGVSAVQKAQMVTQEGNNVHVCGITGNFDDAQTAVKKTFAALANAENGVALSSANSINIGRLAPQIMYYFKSYSDMVAAGEITDGEEINFCVPTGNFGDILAGYFAKLLGLPVDKLICASNANNVLTDFLTTGVYDRKREFYKTSSPSMDILVSSNLERLIYLLSNAEETAGYMKELNEKGVYKVTDTLLNKIKEHFVAGYCDDKATLEEINKTYTETGYLADTHTAVALNVARGFDNGKKTVVLSTASPYKFPKAVLSAIGGDTNCDEFEMMTRLYERTGVAIPFALANLKEKAVLHTDVIDKEDITDYVVKIQNKIK